MAELRRITRRNVQSDFNRVTPQAGFAFTALAEMANEAYRTLEPAAIEEQRRKGAEAGREMAAAREGQRSPRPQAQPRSPDGGLGSVGERPARGAPTPQVTTSPISDSPEGVAADTRKALGIETAMPASLIQTESGGNLNALNNEIGHGGIPGHGGRGQFGHARLQDAAAAGIIPAGTTPQQFAQMPEETQAAVENWHIADIDQAIDRAGGSELIGQQIQGVTVTRDGLRAVAHLGGIGGMQRFISSDGSYNPADSNGTTLLAYLDTHGRASNTPVQFSTRGTPQQPEPETTVRTSDGRIEPRLFSPLSGPIRQAYNASAGVAYVSEMTMSGLEEMMNLSQLNQGNPSAFQQASKEYIDQVVSQSPEMFREDLRNSLTTESQRRYLGMVDEQHREADARANNSSKALMERYSTDYAEALASGRTEDANVARQQLESVLYARESLPGVAWTREQSENLILGALDQADRMRTSSARRQSSEWKDQFDTIIAAANDGRTSDFDALVGNEAAVAAHPELAREAMAMMTVRDNMPEFMSAPPAQQAAILEQERARPIGAEWETDVLDAMTKAHNNTVKALEDDPIQYGMDHLRGSPPALDPSLAATDPAAFVQAMNERNEFTARMQEGGWIDQPAIFTQAEAETFSGLLSKDQPSEVRAALAAALVSGFGPNAVTAFGELDADPVTVFGGQLMAAGGSQSTVQQAFMGQELLDANQVQLPSGSTRMETFSPEVAEAIGGLPNSGAAQEQITKFAQALYASQAQGLDPSSEDAKKLMTQAINQAMGQTEHPRLGKLGGVQEVAGHQVLLPVGVSGERVQQAISNSFVAVDGGVAGNVATAFGGIFGIDAAQRELNEEFWQSASPRGQTPMWGAEPIKMDLFNDDRVRIVAAGGNMYRMEVTLGESVTDITNPDGSVYVFDITKLME